MRRNRHHRYQKLITVLRNGILVQQKWVVIHYYMVYEPLLSKLLLEGLIISYAVNKRTKQYIIQLNYNQEGESVIYGVIYLFRRSYVMGMGVNKLVKILRPTSIILLIKENKFYIDREILMAKKGGELFCIFF